MAMNLAPVPRQRYFDANGNPLAGGKLYTYQAGTSTPQATYTDSGGVTPNTNPVVLDANGEANVWLNDSQSYKFLLKDASDVQQWSQDNVSGAPSVSNSGITTAKIADDAVTAAKLRDDETTDANRAVTTNHIRDSAVTASKLKADASTDANRAVTTNHIRDLAVTTAKIADGAITQAKRAAPVYQISGSSVQFSTSEGPLEDATNLSVTITTTGRPVFVGVISDGIGGVWNSYISTNYPDSSVLVAILRDATTISQQFVCCGEYIRIPTSTIFTVDVPPAGTHTYKIQVGSVVHGNVAGLVYSKLVAFEL